MKIGVIIPTRGDRNQLLDFALKQLDKQTVKPDLIEIVNDKPTSGDKDITKRYRIGFERIIAKGADVIFLIEDDDYYSPFYIETMMENWNKNGNPNIFGIGETIYYHLALRGYNKTAHAGRASAFTTMITKEGILNMIWPKDNYAFTDIEFWKHIQGKTFIPTGTLAIGIKGHKNGTVFGGMGHRANERLYTNRDEGLVWLKNNVDAESFVFYSNISNIVGNKISLQ